MARRYYTAPSHKGRQIHLVPPEGAFRGAFEVRPLCPDPVRSGAVRRLDSPRVKPPGGLRTVEEWVEIHGDRLCFHCVRMSACETGATV